MPSHGMLSVLDFRCISTGGDCRVPDECPKEAVELINCCLARDTRQRRTAKEAVTIIETLHMGPPELQPRGVGVRGARKRHPGQVPGMPVRVQSAPMVDPNPVGSDAQAMQQRRATE